MLAAGPGLRRESPLWYGDPRSPGAVMASPTVVPARIEPVPRDKWPAWCNLIALAAIPSDRGIGDTVARIIGPSNGDKFKAWYFKKFGKSCGCAERQVQWNAQYPYLVEG